MNVKTRSPKLTDAERLAAPCGKCGATPGGKCHDCRGVGKAFCVERGRPDITAKKLQRKADEKNGKARAEYGTLFAYLADQELTPVTPADLQAEKLSRIRREVENAGLAEHDAREGLNGIVIAHMRRVSASLIGEVSESDIWACASNRYRSNWPYVVDMYRKALCTTDRIELEYVLQFDPSRVNQWNHDGRYTVVSKEWPQFGYTPAMSRDEFNNRFALKSIFWSAPTDLPEHDDGGLFERTIGQLKNPLGRSDA
ncbi:MAG: hypothetical protein C0467_06075 [Planctomycetaceae bacterium]|nr:hypothetical protein [Planctomycetaceae bacterium]